jgi:hypothetical protein
MAYDVDESAIRFANYFHVLRELVHLTAGHLALEPRFEVKALLGDHLYDDARAVSKIDRRLSELGDAGAPSRALAELLDRANTEDTQAYLEIAYGELKPTLVHAIRVHLANLEPLIDEPSLRLLTQLLHRQERHITELPAGREQARFDDLGALPVEIGQSRSLKVMSPLEQPARDAFVEIGEHGDEDEKQRLHDLMNAELCAAELTARTSHEHPDMPWDFHVDMAHQAWDHVRHAEVCDRLMATELDCHWGDYPVGFAAFRSSYARDLGGRLALSNGGEKPRDGTLAPVFDYLRADDSAHAQTNARWETHLRSGLDRTGTPVQSSA